jgi:hypothetical protein
MFPDVTLPASLAGLLAVFAPCFTAPSFATFCGLVTGFVAQPGRRTVCGMLVGAGLSRVWPHDRAHYFFAKAAWSADAVGLALARLVVSTLVPAGEPVAVVVRRGSTTARRRHRRRWATATTGSLPPSS